MSVYARIAGGVVWELFTPPADATLAECFHPDVVAMFVDVSTVSPAPQPGWTAAQSAGSWTFAPPAGLPAPTLAQQAQAAVYAGLAITSASEPTLNGTYAVDPLAQGKIAAVSTYVLVNQKFPGGAASYPWIDLAGSAHIFPTTAAFQAFATAVGDYIAALDMIIATGAGTLPAASAAIA